jgi:hypothetical protein
MSSFWFHRLARALLRLGVLVALPALAGYAPAALATTVCVSTTSALRSAMTAWQTASDQTYTIKLVQGTFLYPNDDYWSQPYYGGNANLQLLGGYTAGCASRNLLASNTVLDGEQATHNSSFQVYGSGSILVEGITFKTFARDVEFDGESNDPAVSIVVRYVIGTDLFGAASTQQHYGGFRVTGGSNIRVESSLFYNIHGGDTAAGLEVLGVDDNAFAIVTNVTSAYNGARGMQLGCFQCSGSVLAYNTILYNNTSGDLDTRGSDPDSVVAIAYSDFSAAKSVGAYASIDSINADPKFENPLNGDFRLLNSSPAINAGAPEFAVLGGYGSRDLDGGARVVGSYIDMGALESAVNDLAGQTVTSTGDGATSFTLRSAIGTANANANATTIGFNIAGGCPQVITLSSPLPDVTADTTINGFSEPGSNVNTQYLGYDGRICVIVRAANSSVDHALKVSGTGRLTLQGIEFEGFSTAAVRLAAGNGNIVTGSGFSANPGANANGAGIRVEGTANHALIGGLTPSGRNVFDQGSAGVDFEANGTGRANTVQGNYFGFNFDGSRWTGPAMTYGMYLVGSGGNTLSYNAIGGMSSNGIRLTGPNTTGNIVVSNNIGIGPDNAAVGNGNAGIGIAVSAHDNVIGTAAYLTQSGGGNYIVNNLGPGVWLETTAGNGNRIDGNNAIRDNNGFLPIDLGASTDGFGLGPTANDAYDADVGPNRLENYPYLTQAMRFEADKIALDGYLLPESALANDQTYRLDVFWTDTCVGSGPNDTPRGEMKRYVGYFLVPVTAGTTFKPFPYTTITAPKTIPGTGYLFATATDGSGNTSEPGECFPFTDDYIFANGFN